MKIYEFDPLMAPLRHEMQYGSIERVVMALQRELANEGKSCKIVALAGSEDVTNRGDLIPVTNYDEQIQVALDGVLQPIIHTHRRSVLASPLWQRHQTEVAALATLHGPSEKIAAVYDDYKDTNVAFSVLSPSQLGLKDQGFNVVACIPNGVDTDFFRPAETAEPNTVVYVGRVCPEKNQHEAIRACKAAGTEIILAGPIQNTAYFKDMVEPSVDNDRVVFLGNVGQTTVRAVLERAKAFVMPIAWDDPCPLVALEAQSMGVPVVGYRRGGLVEEVENGVSGYLVDCFDDLVDGLKSANALDRAAIRQRMVQQFDWSVIAHKYMRVFESLQGSSLGPASDATTPDC